MNSLNRQNLYPRGSSRQKQLSDQTRPRLLRADAKMVSERLALDMPGQDISFTRPMSDYFINYGRSLAKMRETASAISTARIPSRPVANGVGSPRIVRQNAWNS